MAGFVAWLDDMVPLRVVAAEDGDIAVAGAVYVAPADRHLEVHGGRLKLVQGPPVSSQKPSGTVLLRSLARNYGRHALAVILTGMGDDGASGLGAVREAGGHTIAEDESTAVVYGMPAVAVRLGAVSEQLPLYEIGPRLLRLGGSPRAAP
jgi:two-component system chemotaxis response regulator CheB